MSIFTSTMKNKKLTIKDVQKAVEELNATYEQRYVFIKHAALNGATINERSVIILCGKKVYFPEYYTEKDAVILELTEYNLEPESPKINFHIEENLSVIANENVFNSEQYYGNK